MNKAKLKNKKNKKTNVSRPRPLHFLGPPLFFYYLLLVTFVQTKSNRRLIPGGVLRYIGDGDVRSPFLGFENCDLRTFFGFEIL